MGTVYTATTSHGTVLSMAAGSRRIGHVHPQDVQGDTLALHLLSGGRFGTRCLPFAVHVPTGRVLVPREISPGSGILLLALAADAPALIRSAATHRLVAALPGGGVEGNRTEAATWERFDVRRDDAFDPDAVAALRPFMAQAVLLFAQSAPVFAGVTALLAEEPSPAAASLIEALWPMMTLAELDRFAKQLRADRAMASRLAAMFSDDPYATEVLPTLLRSLAPPVPADPSAVRPAGAATPWRWKIAGETVPGRTPPLPPVHLGPVSDHLARDGYDGTLSSLAHACNASLRRTVKPTRGVAVVATARSEGIYVVEWIAHYRLLGVEAFYLYTNNNDDGSDALLAALHAAGVISWVRSEPSAGVSAQNKAYGHALNVNRAVLDHRWALFVDLDEFLVLNPARYRSIADFARWHETRETDAVGINWVMVGSSGQSNWTDAPLTRRNPNVLNAPNSHIKVMLTPQSFIQAHPHFPFADRRRSFTFRLASGELHHSRKQSPENYHRQAFTDDPSCDDACLYHYNFKSVQEFAWKVSRNRGDFPLDHGIDFHGLDAVAVGSFAGQHHSAEFVADTRMARSATALDDEMARLRALPGVATAERQVIATFSARSRTLVEMLARAPQLGQFGAAGDAMRALLKAAL